MTHSSFAASPLDVPAAREFLRWAIADQPGEFVDLHQIKLIDEIQAASEQERIPVLVLKMEKDGTCPSCQGDGSAWPGGDPDETTCSKCGGGGTVSYRYIRLIGATPDQMLRFVRGEMNTPVKLRCRQGWNTGITRAEAEGFYIC